LVITDMIRRKRWRKKMQC